jgi:tetratricopeptide (TPR) repeat protein
MKLTAGFVASIAMAVLFVSGCSTTDKAKSNDLDISTGKGTESSSKSATTTQDPQSKSTVPVDAVISWQQFFKTPPTVDDRKIIEQELTKPASTSSSAELIKRGRNEVALGRFVKAEASFREAIRIDEDSLECQLELAMLYLRRQDLTRAFEFLSQLRESLATQENPDPSFVFRYRYTLAVGLISRGDRDQGHRVLSELISLDKSFTPGYAALASSYLAMGKYRIAEFIAKRGIDRGKDDPALYNVLGVVAEHAGQLESAEEWYNRAFTVAPTFAPALVNRAGVHIKRFEYDAAEEDLIRALMYQPHNVDGLISLSIVHRRAGKFAAARSALTKALDIDPENALARFNLAVLLADDLAKPNEAIRLLSEVIQTAKDNDELKAMAKNYINNIKDNREAF